MSSTRPTPPVPRWLINARGNPTVYVYDDLNSASDSSGASALSYFSDVEYDNLGRRWKTHGDNGTRKFEYDSITHRLAQDRFDGSTSNNWLERNYDEYFPGGSVKTITGTAALRSSTQVE